MMRMYGNRLSKQEPFVTGLGMSNVVQKYHLPSGRSSSRRPKKNDMTLNGFLQSGELTETFLHAIGINGRFSGDRYNFFTMGG